MDAVQPEISLIRCFSFELYQISMMASNQIAVLADGTQLREDSIIWLQGVVVDVHNDDASVVIDDGTDTVRCSMRVLSVVKRGGEIDQVRVGNLVDIKGELLLATLPEPGMLGRSELRNCSCSVIQAPKMETLWWLEQCQRKRSITT